MSKVREQMPPGAEILFDEKTLAEAVDRIAEHIIDNHDAGKLLLIGVLNEADQLTHHVKLALTRAGLALPVAYVAIRNYVQRGSSALFGGVSDSLPSRTYDLARREVVALHTRVRSGTSSGLLTNRFASYGADPEMISHVALIDQPRPNDRGRGDWQPEFAALTLEPETNIIGYGIGRPDIQLDRCASEPAIYSYPSVPPGPVQV